MNEKQINKQNNISFWQAVKDTFKSKKDSKSSMFPWLQTGLVLVGFTAGVLVTTGVDIISRMITNESDTEEISEADKCREQGGRYDNENETCIMVTSDRGSPCSDNSECEGWCLADEDDTLGEEKMGYCSDDFNPNSCFKFIDGGIVNSICMD